MKVPIRVASRLIAQKGEIRGKGHVDDMSRSMFFLRNFPKVYNGLHRVKPDSGFN
jgi:hypothetical protein